MHLMLSKKGTATYASVAECERVDGKPVKKNVVYLGKVVDLEKGVFENRERGLFTYDLGTGTYGKADLAGLPKKKAGRKMYAADFGDVYVLDRFIGETCIYECIDACGSPNPDTFKALVMYYLLARAPNSWADDWYGSNYASILFPDADMDDRRISEFLKRIGEAEIQRKFFEKFLERTVGSDPTAFIVDSTGVPNSVRMPITGISNHNGDVSLETRVILVCRKSDRMPLFVRYVPGNVNDSITLVRTIEELRCYGLNTDYVLIDAGYCTLENMRSLVESHIGFITRLRPNFDMAKDMVKDHVAELDMSKRVLYNDRFLRVVSRECTLTGSTRKVWVHLILDEDMKNTEDKAAYRKFHEGRITEDELNRTYETSGIFTLVTSFWVLGDDVVSMYFERGGIEQLIDVGKTDGRLGKVAVHSEETFRGKLLLDFTVLAVGQMLQNHLKRRKEELSSRKKVKKDDIPGRDLSVSHALYLLRNQKCDVFENKVLPREVGKRVNDVYRLFGYEIPLSIDRGQQS